MADDTTAIAPHSGHGERPAAGPSASSPRVRHGPGGRFAEPNFGNRARGSRTFTDCDARPLVCACLIALVSWSSACTRTSSRERFPATENLLEIVETVPRAGDVDVDPDTQLQICLSGYLDPRTVDVTSMRLASGEFAPYDTSTSLELFPIHARGDLSKLATERWCPGSVLSTRSTLTPSATLHRMWIAPSMIGWQGEELDTSTPGWTTPDDPEDDPVFIVEFTYAERELDGDTTESGGDTQGTSDTDGEPSEVAPPPTLTDLFAPGSIFSPENPACSCHREPATVAIELLDLRTPATAFEDLVHDTSVRSTGFPMVSPRNPAESFLVHVLLRNPDGSGLAGLRGSPMPPDSELPYSDLVSIARWIDAGAPE